MHGLMMNRPLMISSLIRHADRCHGDTEIVSRTVEGPIHRYTYRDAHSRSRQLARALAAPGRRAGSSASARWPGTAIATSSSTTRVSGMGAVIHTINPRLFHDQLTYIVNHADDRLRLLRPHVRCRSSRSSRAQCPGVSDVDRDDRPRAHAACGRCRTCSATKTCLPRRATISTGPNSTRTPPRASATRPARRATRRACCSAIARRVLHAYAPSACRTPRPTRRRASCCPIVPMFHVNAWGIPYAAPLVGAKLVFPGAGTRRQEPLRAVREASASTSSAGVPTVWLGLISYMKQNNLKFSTLKTTTIGGAACPPAMMRTLRDDFGVRVHARLGHDGDEPGRHDRQRRRRSIAIFRPTTGSRCR